MLRRLSTDKAVELLEESLFGARHWDTSTPVFNHSGEHERPDFDRIREECRRFAGRVPFFRCQIGEDLYRKREHALAWVRALREEAAAANP